MDFCRTIQVLGDILLAIMECHLQLFYANGVLVLIVLKYNINYLNL